MDLTRMLEMCRRDQWSVHELDWTRAPRAMERDDEIAIVQHFTDMAWIERLAGALFLEQQRRVADPTLRAIFGTFVNDEVRHAQAAQMLADFYDVHHYEVYRPNQSLQKFFPYFIDAIRHLSDDVANAYITAGELILDVALLRSLNDYVKDDMSEQAMRLINRDESRHIAIDYYMVEYYASDAYVARNAERESTLAERARAAVTFGNMLYAAAPFIRDVFFLPMERLDRGGRRIREAIKRFQLLGVKPGARRTPFGAFMLTLSDLYNHQVVGPLFGKAIARVAGLPPEYMATLYSDGEATRARAMSYEEMANEALGLKLREW